MDVIAFEQLQEEAIGIYGLNEAKFNILPKFKADPKTKKIVEAIEKGDMLIKQNGITDDQSSLLYKGALDDTNSAMSDICFLMSSGFFGVAGGFAVNPLFGIAVGVATHLAFRLIRYFSDKENEQQVDKIAKRQISHLSKIADKVKGKDKDKVLSAKKDIEDELKKLEDKSKKKDK